MSVTICYIFIDDLLKVLHLCITFKERFGDKRIIMWDDTNAGSCGKSPSFQVGTKLND